QDEMQVPFRDVPVPFVGEIQCGPHQEKRSVSTGVDDSTRIIGFRRIGTGRSSRRGLKVLVVVKGMPSDRLHYLPPFMVLIYFIDLGKSLVDIGHRRYKRCILLDVATHRFTG